jgi:hypothetical protein
MTQNAHISNILNLDYRKANFQEIKTSYRFVNIFLHR